MVGLDVGLDVFFTLLDFVFFALLDFFLRGVAVTVGLGVVSLRVVFTCTRRRRSVVINMPEVHARVLRAISSAADDS